MKKIFLLAALWAAASACESADGMVGADTPTPDVGGGTADTTSSQDATLFPEDSGLDEVDEGSTDKADASCVANPAMDGQVETLCTNYNGAGVWRFDSASCSWAFGDLPNADPAITWGIQTADLEEVRTVILGCPPQDQ